MVARTDLTAEFRWPVSDIVLEAMGRDDGRSTNWDDAHIRCQEPWAQGSLNTIVALDQKKNETLPCDEIQISNSTECLVALPRRCVQLVDQGEPLVSSAAQAAKDNNIDSFMGIVSAANLLQAFLEIRRFLVLVPDDF